MHRGTYYESIKDICHTNRCHITHFVQSPIPHQIAEMLFVFLIFKQRNLGIVKKNEIMPLKNHNSLR